MAIATFRVHFQRRFAVVAACVLLSALTGCGQLEALRGRDLPTGLARAQKLLRNRQASKADIAAAYAEFDKFIAADPNNIDSYLLVMNICMNAGRPHLVTQYGEKGRQAASNAPSPKLAALLRLTAASYLHLNNPAKAVEFNEPALQLMPEDPGYQNDLGFSYAELYDADMPGAVAKLQEALRLTRSAVEKAKRQGATERDLGIYVDSLGWVYYKLHRYDEAIQNLQRAADLAPDVKEIHVHLAAALHARDRKDEAWLVLQKALKMDPHFAPAVELERKWRPERPEDPASRAQSAPSAGASEGIRLRAVP